MTDWPQLPPGLLDDPEETAWRERIIEHIIRSVGVPAALYEVPLREIFPAVPIDQATIDKEQPCNLDDEAF